MSGWDLRRPVEAGPERATVALRVRSCGSRTWTPSYVVRAKVTELEMR